MLCSIKSDSDWLHRLRASKGFPVESALDLEHFLSSSPNPSPLVESQTSSSIPSPEDSKISASLPSKNSVATHNCEKEQWFDLMSNVIAELFNMGGRDYSKMQALKSARKQPNPKICVISSSTSMQDSCMLGGQVPAMSPSSADNSVAEAIDGGKESGFVEAEEEISQAVGDVDLDLFSRTVVTIIDTSSPTWKSEKLLLRKKNVWKIRDKKRKLVDTSRKKRKLDRSGPSGAYEKKLKKRNLLLSDEVSSDSKRREAQLQLSSGKHFHGRKKAACRSMKDDRSRTKRSGLESSQPQRKPVKRDISAVHMKSIPTSTKNGAHSKMNMKDKH